MICFRCKVIKHFDSTDPNNNYCSKFTTDPDNNPAKIAATINAAALEYLLKHKMLIMQKQINIQGILGDIFSIGSGCSRYSRRYKKYIW